MTIGEMKLRTLKLESEIEPKLDAASDALDALEVDLNDAAWENAYYKQKFLATIRDSYRRAGDALDALELLSKGGD